MALTPEEEKAKSAGFAMPEGTHYISEGDDAIRKNAVTTNQLIESHEHPEYRMRGTLPSSDLNDLFNESDSGVWHLSSANTYTNLPSTGGLLIIDATSFAAKQEVVPLFGDPAMQRKLITYSAKRWSRWENTTVGEISANADLNDFRSYGDYVIPNQSVAASLNGWPSEHTTPQPGALSVRSTPSGLIMQTLHTYGTNKFMYRSTSGISPVPFPYTDWTDPAAPSSSGGSGNNAHALLVEDFTRRRGGRRRTNGKAVAAIRFDHGLSNLSSIALPLCRSRGIVPAIALNSRNWNYPENTGITAETVNGWVEAGEVEIWNHGATHGNATTTAELTDEIVNGLNELRQQLPAAEIDGWVVPGVTANPSYGGFNNGANIQAFYETEAGRMILDHHAISTGYIPGTHRPILDGTVRQGGHQFTIDSQTLAAFKTQVDAAITERTGLQIMLHPSQLNLSGKLTTETFTAMLDYLVEKQTAGDLLLWSPYDMAVADAT